MMAPEALPDYIRRLGAEPVFKGRSFAALNIRHDAVAAAPPATQPLAQPGAAAAAMSPRTIDFILFNRLDGAGGKP
jgi:hypothetical protein